MSGGAAGYCASCVATRIHELNDREGVRTPSIYQKKERTMQTPTEAKAANDAVIIERYRDKMVSGQAFAMSAHSLRSILGYKPPPSHRHVAAIYTAAGKLAAMGNVYVPFAMALGRAKGQYASPGELLGSAYDQLAFCVRAGYTDVIRLASPEPGRRKDAERPYTLREVLVVSGAMHDASREFAGAVGSLPGPGWCEAALRREVGLPEWVR